MEETRENHPPQRIGGLSELVRAAAPRPLVHRSDTFALIACALAKAQGEFQPIEKNCTARISSRRTGQTFTYDYADLAAIRDAVSPALTKYGIAILSGVETANVEAGDPRDGESRSALVRVQTELVHESGEWFRSPVLTTVVDLAEIKEVGIATTYFRRYQLQTLLGIAPEEDKDDGTGQRKEDVRSAPPAANGGRFTCQHGHKHGTADEAKTCGAAAPDRTLEPGNDPPAMSKPGPAAVPWAAIAAAIEAKDWRTTIAGLNSLPDGEQKRKLQDDYNAARYGGQKGGTR